MSRHMTSTYRNMFAVRAITLLCLMSASYSASPNCTDLVQPLDQVDPHDLEGRWALVADSLKIIHSETPVQTSNSTSIDFYNSTLSKANRFGELCDYISGNVSIEGPNYDFMFGRMYKFNGTLFRTSCSDCLMLSFNVESPYFETKELCLFSKRRAVDEKEMREFSALVECLKMPEPVVMDPTQKLCPAQLGSRSSDWGENRESKGFGHFGTWYLLTEWIKWMSIHAVSLIAFARMVPTTLWMWTWERRPFLLRWNDNNSKKVLKV